MTARSSGIRRDANRPAAASPTSEIPGFLDMQAAVGISKHIGGYRSTDELLSLCHVRQARSVLDVGCGIGVGPAHIARTYGCHVTGVDLSPSMLRWARKRVRQEHVEQLVTLRTADVQDLPFPDNSFDVVLSESVFAFVDDKERAIRECARVVRPGGYVGLNEALWLEEPPPDMVEQVQAALGLSVPTELAWQALWAGSGLEERVVRVYQVDAAQEIKDRLRWIGYRWILGAWGRALMLVVKDPSMRTSLKQQLDVPKASFDYVGYGLLVGRKPDLPQSPEGTEAS